MYVISRIEVEETVSILSPAEPKVSVSMEEFEHYVDLFEEMQERMDNEEGEESEKRDKKMCGGRRSPSSVTGLVILRNVGFERNVPAVTNPESGRDPHLGSSRCPPPS